MTLPASQQRALDAIDDVLQSAEPRLATMFGVFTDLTRLDAMPAAETLEPGPWWTRHRLAGPCTGPAGPGTSGTGPASDGICPADTPCGLAAGSAGSC